MTELRQNSPAKDWLEAELADTLDEDYELEISEPELSSGDRQIYKKSIRLRSTGLPISAS